MKLSVIIPVYNERDTLPQVLAQLVAIPLEIGEVLVVDDASHDGTSEWLDEQTEFPVVRVIRHALNRGKGAAVASGIREATGDIIVIQDGDLEYNPADLPAVVQPILDGKADVVYGSRFAGGQARRVVYRRNRLGNWFLTWLSNLFTGLNLTDMECGYKAFLRKLVEDIEIRERGFGVEPELTAKLAKKHPRFFEVAISYQGRTFAEGKKIRWHDGIRAIYAIVKYNLFG